jgi:hypothetical protein
MLSLWIINSILDIILFQFQTTILWILRICLIIFEWNVYWTCVQCSTSTNFVWKLHSCFNILQTWKYAMKKYQPFDEYLLLIFHDWKQCHWLVRDSGDTILAIFMTFSYLASFIYILSLRIQNQIDTDTLNTQLTEEQFTPWRNIQYEKICDAVL